MSGRVAPSSDCPTSLTRIWSEVGGDPAALSAVTVPPHPVPLPARTDVASLAWASVAAASLAAATLAGAARVDLEADRIAVAYASERHFTLDGAPPTAFAPLSGFFRTADGWVRTHGNYPHHAAALRAALGLSAEAGRDAATAALLQRTAAEASVAITAAGGICAAVAPERPDLDAALRATPLVAVDLVGDAPPRPLAAPAPEAPLRGVRVLDLTRVIAGPVATRTLALLGADVLRVDPPAIPEIEWQHLDTGHGKRSAVLDLRTDADRARFEALVATADVVVLGYRPAGLAGIGLSPSDLAARHPGLVIAQLSAWGADAPTRRGFDSIVQAAGGIALVESADGETPGALPAQALDHSAGYLLAAAVMRLLERRSRDGGTWLASTSLRRVAAELLGMPRSADPTPAPGAGASVDPTAHVQSFEVAGHTLTTAAPAVAYTGGPTAYAAPRPWGLDAPEWLPR